MYKKANNRGWVISCGLKVSSFSNIFCQHQIEEVVNLIAKHDLRTSHSSIFGVFLMAGYTNEILDSYWSNNSELEGDIINVNKISLYKFRIDYFLRLLLNMQSKLKCLFNRVILSIYKTVKWTTKKLLTKFSMIYYLYIKYL